MNTRQEARFKVSRIRYYFSSIVVLTRALSFMSLVHLLLPSLIKRVYLRKEGLTFFLKTLLDLMVLKEVTIDEEYQNSAIGVCV